MAFSHVSPPAAIERRPLEEVVGPVVDVEDAAATRTGTGVAGVAGDQLVGDAVGAGVGDDPARRLWLV